jgi:site-specific recombinase XerD
MATQEGPQRSASVGQSKATGGTKRTTGSTRRVPPGSKVTEARATAQRAKLDAQAEARNDQVVETARNTKRKPLGGKKEQQRLLTNRRTNTTIGRAIDDYLLDHMGGNSSDKTLEWHRAALGLMRIYFEGERGITLVGEIDAPDINAWFAHMRTSPGGHGKPRSERTIQTYARSARAFFHWLVRRETIGSNPFDRVTFPKVGKPLIQTIDADEFARLLLACTPPNETGPIAERAAVRNLSYYLDKYRPDEEELAEWGSAGEDHLFLSETRLPLTKNGVTLLFRRIRERAGMTGKRISPHIFRHSFAIRYLVLGNDSFSLQELLGHEDMTTVKNYMHMNDETIQSQKRKYSPGDHLPTRIPGPRETRRRGYRTKGQNVKKREQ